MSTPLPTREAAELLGVSTRTVQRRGIDTVAALPVESQWEWARKPVQRVVDISTPAPGQLALGLTLPEAPNLSQEDREEAERRYRAIEPLVRPDEYRGLWLECGGRKLEVIDYVARENKTRPRTIYHWLLAWKKGGLPGLVTRARSDKGQPRALNAAAMRILAAWALPRKGRYGEYTDAEIHRAYHEERAWRAAHVGKRLGDFERRKYVEYVDSEGRLTPDALLPDCSYETIRTWLKKVVPTAVRVMATAGPEAYSATQEIISHRAIDQVDPLDYVVMDHRRLDLFCMVREGARGWKLIRPWLTAAIDMRTRKWLAWVIVESPSSDSIAAVIKRICLDWGVPKACYWDNGKDFTCEWLEGRHTRETQTERIRELNPAMRGVLESLGIRVHHAIVRRARAKLIEPNFGLTADYDHSLPWWCGHKPGARPEQFGELVQQHERWVAGEAAEPAFPTIETVAGLYDVLLERDLNEREKTSGQGMRKVTPTGYGFMSPNEAWETLIRKVERRVVDPTVLQFAFSKRKTLTVRQGELRMNIAGTVHHYRMIANANALVAVNGEQVEIAYDALDLGTIAVYIEGRFVGLAEAVELRRMGEAGFVEDERARRVSRREIRRAIVSAHSAWVPDVMERARRRLAVTPTRLDPEREEIAAAVPVAVIEGAEAKRADADVPTFAESADAVDLVRVSAQAAYRDDDPSDEFDFFGSGGN